MTKLRKAVFLTLSCIGLAVFYAPSAFAQAAVINDFDCNLFDGNGNLFFCDATEKGNSTHSTIAPSGNVILKCNCQVPDGAEAPGRAELTEGFGCNTFAGFTTDTRSVVTKGGRSNLTCTIHP